ncbi:MAG: M18 family aminopeptidase [Endozoicomonadaceae bacterium]|nr:M18 family aminopeptidase [Endozoicomonadaceae bacterium]MCY4330220.1 M18 family aminopeptidase [Endozoicomonadaceae bacterium]
MTKNEAFNHQLIQFLNASPTPFHAVKELADLLEKAGFKLLNETDIWCLQKNTGYFVIRNQSSLIAFTTGDCNFSEQGFRMTGAHTDSPCLKIKPNPDIQKYHCLQLGVEVYGGALLAPWFDRDLSIAGRVAWYDGTQIHQTLIDLKRAVATIPSLAIHLDSEQNNRRTINPQTDISPVLATIFTEDSQTDQTLHHAIKESLSNIYPHLNIDQILDFELFLYDTQPAAIIGLNNDFIASARLDNLLSCFTATQAIIKAKQSLYPSMIVCNDHEEVGSASTSGAQGPFLKQVLQRIVKDNESRIRTIQHSLMISADNAHARHPNFPDKHDKKHAPAINHGPVIKINVNQCYATNSESSAVFRHLCTQENIPVQLFCSRCDMRCGSTIGPITASEIGVRTLDVGLPTYGMHSVRELAGTQDAIMLEKVLTRFYNTSAAQLQLTT